MYACGTVCGPVASFGFCFSETDAAVGQPVSRKPDFIPTPKRNRGRNDEGLIMRDRAKFTSAIMANRKCKVSILVESFQNFWTIFF